ncbi:YhgE/Pip family protein [Kibdelosporangium lantanae]|uniref:YhgE/Pip family protein n=1 Tax=Kibdelosporangium lantanae TaxID=1497396 RepID=A0ABW3M3B0_9PSEU
MHRVVADVTRRITERSAESRHAYLDRIRAMATDGPARAGMACSNLAHGFAACEGTDRLAVRGLTKPGVAIISSYNDLLSAHQPFDEYPAWLKQSVREAGGVAQFAGGVPAMCDGITQGRAGMELSLFSREVIAMATGIALSHEMFDGSLLLGVCDKIVPGLLIGALAFLAFASLTFTAILHALNAFFGAVGKFLGLVLLILQLISSGGTFPWQTLPDVLYPLHSVLPMGYVVDGMRHLLYGGSVTSVWTDLGVLAGYLVGALLVSTVAAHRQRVWTPARLKPELVL